MAVFGTKKRHLKTDEHTGFGSNPDSYGGRFVTKDGSPNVVKTGLPFLDQISWFHTLLKMPIWKLHLVIFFIFIIINFIFASIYYLIGVDHLNGVVATSEIEKFAQAYFFSTQTYTTVGYGHISPKGLVASTVAAIEALSGLLSFALATGLLYGRFSKPKAYLKFSENAIIAPFQEGMALMLRLAPFKNTTLTDAIAKITLGLKIEEEGKVVNRFFPLELEYDRVNSLTLSWTLVHPINENSPLFGFDSNDFKTRKGEVLIFVKAFDDMFSNTVVARTSYTFDEIVYGVKFIPMYDHNSNATKTVLHLDKIDKFENVPFN